MPFDAGDLAALDSTEEIEIETAAPGGPVHRTTIWVVVDDDEAFIRSVRGAKARWYREATANPSLTIHAGGRTITATATQANDADAIARTSAALVRKYTGIDGLPEMLEPDTFETTLRLTPS
jgi:hypothetical protein